MDIKLFLELTAIKYPNFQFIADEAIKNTSSILMRNKFGTLVYFKSVNNSKRFEIENAIIIVLI